jgi:hypothetical protein
MGQLTTHPDSQGVVEQQISQWIIQHVAFPNKKLHGRCEKVVLRHLNIERKNQGDVGTFPVRLEEGAEDEIQPLVTQIADAAQSDANDLKSGVQTYAIYAYFTLDKSYSVRKIFRVSAEEEMERDAMPTEQPTEKGLVAQTMRHLEAVMRHSTISSNMQLQTMQRENARLSEMNERFSQQQIDFLVLMQDLMNDATKRRLDERREEAGLAMKSEALEKLNALAPVIINRIAGKPILPEPDKSFMLMSALLENLSDDQQQKLMGMLSDSQKMVLAETMTEYEKRKSKSQQGQSPLMVGKNNELPPPSTGGSLVPVAPDNILRARMTASEEKTTDPVLQRIEQDGENYMARFRDFLKPPTQGDK